MFGFGGGHLMSKLIFESKYADASTRLTFDFISRLAIGETLSSVNLSSSVYSGVSVTALTLGAGSISGTRVTSLCAGGTEGVTYLVAAYATTSEGQILPLTGYLTIVPKNY